MNSRGRLISILIGIVLMLGLQVTSLAAGPRYRVLGFDQLLGWDKDNQQAALEAFIKSCADIRAKEWKPLCAMASTGPTARTFFETFFTPVIVRPNAKALFTGYYEPILEGSLYRVGKYKYPIYRRPTGLQPADPMLTRAAIENGSLEHKGLEIAYVDNPVEAFYLHIQGSGRIQLTNGNTLRVGYAAENGHVYRSVAGELVRRGEIRLEDASIDGIKEWFRKNPEKGRLALQFNPSYVFFRIVETLSQSSGPLGALERPISAMRSLAVDPKFVQMGAPVWIEKGGQGVLRRLMVAQDVGSAIKGPQRADIFFGSGPLAGKLAGQTKNGGRMIVLMPIALANRLAPEG